MSRKDTGRIHLSVPLFANNGYQDNKELMPDAGIHMISLHEVVFGSKLGLKSQKGICHCYGTHFILSLFFKNCCLCDSGIMRIYECSIGIHFSVRLDLYF